MPWASGENAIRPTPSSSTRVQEPVLDPAVEHRVRGLVDQQRRAQLAQDRHRLAGARGRVGRDAHVARLALADGGVQGAHGLLQRRVRVEPVVVEDVDPVQPHPLERLVQRAQQVLARAQVAVGAGPHVPARLGRDHQLVAVAGEVLAEDAAEVGLGRPVGRAVVVGQVEVGDAEVERAPQDVALGLERLVVAEVVPQAERDRREVEAAAADAAVGHAPVAAGGGNVGLEDVHAAHHRAPTGTIS